MKTKLLSSYVNRKNNEAPLFTCELISDNHQLYPYVDKRLKTVLDEMLNRDVRHVFFTGDLTNNGLSFQFQSLFKLLDTYPFDYQFALGNHDTFHRFHEQSLRTNETMNSHVYRQHVYHKTNYDAISIYVLNTQKPQEDNIYFERNQLLWLEEQLANDHKPWKLILCHQPLANSHPNSEDRTMHIGFQNAKLLSVLRKFKGIIYASGHLHNSYTLQSMCQVEDIVCINIPGFSKIDYGSKELGIGVSLSFYHTFIWMSFTQYAQHRMIDTVHYVYDKEKNCVLWDYPQ